MLANGLENNRSESYCYISCNFGIKKGGQNAPSPQYKVSKKLSSTNRVKKRHVCETHFQHEGHKICKVVDLASNTPFN